MTCAKNCTSERQLPATMWYLGIRSISLMLRRYLQTGVETHANAGRPRVAPYGKWPDKCVQVWISHNHSSEKSLRVAMVSEEPFVCQIPSRLLSNFALLEATPAMVCQKQASKQTQKNIHIYKYSSWLHAFVSANSSRLACLVSVV